MKKLRGSCAKALLASLALIITLATSGFGSKVIAADVTNFSDTLSTIQESVVANHTIRFTIQDSWQADETLTIDFPTGFTNSGFATGEPEDFDITDDSVDRTLVASGGCGGGSDEIAITAVDTVDPIGFTFTICTGDSTIAAGSVVVIEIGTHATAGSAGNDQITNQSAADNSTDAILSLTGASGFTDTGQLALEIVSDNTATVTATVDPRITCTFANMTPTFASLTGPVTTATGNTTVTITTNAANGFILTVRDIGDTVNPGLYKSTGTSYLIGSSNNAFDDTDELQADVDGFGIQGSTSGGSGASVTIAARYDQTGDFVGGLELTDQTLASATGPVTSRVITSTHKAAVSGAAVAGVYTDTLTYVCTGVY